MKFKTEMGTYTGIGLEFKDEHWIIKRQDGWGDITCAKWQQKPIIVDTE